MMLIAMVTSALLYVIVSLLEGKEPFNMDRLLHRGRYAREDATKEQLEGGTRSLKRRSLSELIGITEDFSRVDKILYTFVTSWSFVWSAVFVVGLLLNAIFDLDVNDWIPFWKFYVLLAVGLGIVTTLWFTIGGFVDLADLLRRLKTINRNVLDDGSVVDHHSADEE
jgi:SSS family solute:Na+ symporter